MAVVVRLFAALREAAGGDTAEVAAGPLPEILATLCERHGATFRARLGYATVLLDGSAVDRDSDVAVPDGAELALLPPVSGGARRGPGR